MRSLWIGFDIKGEAGTLLKPQEIHHWREDEFKKHPPEKPFYYRTDALAGMALVHLNQHLKSPFTTPKMNYSFCFEAWRALEPHHELYEKAQIRVGALRSHLKRQPANQMLSFEGQLSEIMSSAMSDKKVEIETLVEMIDVIDKLETEMSRPLLYNFSLNLSKGMIDRLMHLHSFLFNMRALVAMDYNAFINDPTHEALRVDSIEDYLAKADYVANDSLLYLQLKKQKDKMPAQAYETLRTGFLQYSHNGACLIENLPASFLSSLQTGELEETLYLVQMDWLLGTEAGLLYRIREELFGLQDGYDKIFWPELAERPNSSPQQLSISCELTEEDVYPAPFAA